jgi:hypothetical protein
LIKGLEPLFEGKNPFTRRSKRFMNATTGTANPQKSHQFEKPNFNNPSKN